MVRQSIWQQRHLVKHTHLIVDRKGRGERERERERERAPVTYFLHLGPTS
jgi:hypothetical protein